MWLSLIFEEIMITMQCTAFVMGVSVRGLKAGLAVVGAAGYGCCVVDLCSISTFRTVILGGCCGLVVYFHMPFVQLCGQNGEMCRSRGHGEKVAWV